MVECLNYYPNYILFGACFDSIAAKDLFGSLTRGGFLGVEFSILITLSSLKGFARFLGLDFQNYPGS